MFFVPRRDSFGPRNTSRTTRVGVAQASCFIHELPGEDVRRVFVSLHDGLDIALIGSNNFRVSEEDIMGDVFAAYPCIIEVRAL